MNYDGGETTGMPQIDPELEAAVSQAGFNWPLLIGIAVIVLFLWALKKFIYHWSVNNSHFDHAIFIVRLPKEKPKEDSQGMTVQQLREEIARGETVFSAIGGLKAQKGLTAMFLGRRDHFSFEIVAHRGRISFYVSAPLERALYIEQQIHAHYPEASIEEVSDFNPFNAKSYISAAYLKSSRSFIFPFKTYNDMETDPMNSVINVMSKLQPEESISIQYTVRSARKSWHKAVKNMVMKAYKKQSVSEIFKVGNNAFQGTFNFFVYHIILGAFNVFESRDGDPQARQKELSEKEREMLKKMEDKNSKAGLDANIRVVVSAQSEGQSAMYLDNIGSAFSEYNYYEYGNSFRRPIKKNQKRTINNFIYHRFIDKQSFVVNTEEMASLFHFPLPHTETPNIDWLLSKTAPAPNNIPTEGVMLGFNLFRGIKTDIRIKRVDRRRHAYIIGKSGTGKSVMLNNMAIQDIENGDGVCVMDPNGDLIEDILSRIPPERAEDVIIFSPGDMERPLGLNLLEYDIRYPEQKSFVINEMINIFDKLYDLKSTGGPMFEQYMRNALLLIMDDPETGSTLMEVPKVLADENFRRMKLSRCQNPTVVDFWRKEAEKAGGDAALANIVPYITSKLTPFVSNDMMRPIIGQQKSSFNLRDVMDKQKILLVELPKGAIGETNAYLLGMIIVGKILMAALSRTDMAPELRKDFYLYIDEFQNFTTDSICQILSEARKYALCLTVAHQYIGQLSKGQDSKIKDAIFGNVGTMISFRVGSEDAEFLVKDFGPVFNEYDLVNVGRGGFIKLLVDGAATRPFSLQTVWPLMGTHRQGLSAKVRELSRFKFGQDRKLVDLEILRRVGMVR